MWVCDLCLEVNDNEHVKCIKCGEPKAPELKLADEIRDLQQPPPDGHRPEAAGYIPTSPLIVPSSTTVSPSLVRGGFITLAVGWAILVAVLLFSIAKPPTPSTTVTPAGAASTATSSAPSSAASAEFIRDRQLLRVFLVIVLPLAVLFIPSTHWEFNPKSGLLIRSRGNMLSRREDGVWDMASIDKVHVGEISAAAASTRHTSGDGDGFNVLLTVQIVFKNEDTLNIGPELSDGNWAQRKVDEINRFLHKWQRQL